jgi:transcriptional regulator MraZ
MLQSGEKWFKVEDMQGLLLSGTFDHTLDVKGRVTLPARYRQHFQNGVVLVRLPDDEPCVSVYHPDTWAQFDTKYIEPLNVFQSKGDAWTTRNIYMNQDHVELDNQGRVLLSARHIREAGLAGKVIIIGARDHLEIWDPDTFARRQRETRSPDA